MKVRRPLVVRGCSSDGAGRPVVLDFSELQVGPCRALQPLPQLGGWEHG